MNSFHSATCFCWLGEKLEIPWIDTVNIDRDLFFHPCDCIPPNYCTFHSVIQSSVHCYMFKHRTGMLRNGNSVPLLFYFDSFCLGTSFIFNTPQKVAFLIPVEELSLFYFMGICCSISCTAGREITKEYTIQNVKLTGKWIFWKPIFYWTLNVTGQIE